MIYEPCHIIFYIIIYHLKCYRPGHVHLERWYTQIHIWIHETYDLFTCIHIWTHMHKFMYIWIMNSCMKWLHEFMVYINSYVKLIYEFMSVWIHVYEFKCIGSEFIIHHIESEFMNLISLTWIHVWHYYLKMKRMQYSEFVEFNSVVKYGIWIRCNEFKRITTQISVMNTYMKWIVMNSHIWIHGRIYRFV